MKASTSKHWPLDRTVFVAGHMESEFNWAVAMYRTGQYYGWSHGGRVQLSSGHVWDRTVFVAGHMEARSSCGTRQYLGPGHVTRGEWQACLGAVSACVCLLAGSVWWRSIMDEVAVSRAVWLSITAIHHSCDPVTGEHPASARTRPTTHT